MEIPVSTYTLILYLETISEIIIVVIELLVTYKIFSRTETEPEIFMKAFKDVAIEKRKTETADESTAMEDTPPALSEEISTSVARERGTTGQHGSSDVEDKHVLEAGGAIAGELARKLIDYLDCMQAQITKAGTEQLQEDKLQP